jgi:tetratricopeptide (TPR) repeat protein
MFRRYFLPILATVAFVLSTSLLVSAQNGELRGLVTLKQADGKVVPAADAIVDVFRTDLPGDFQLKTNKKGDFVHAGLPALGTFTVAVSMPGAQPYFLPGVRVGTGEIVKIELSPGDGKRLTRAEIKTLSAGTPGASTGGGKETAEEKAKREELIKKNKEIEASNARNININEVVNRTFKAGNEALKVRNFDEAIKQYQEGLAADPEQGLLYLQTSEALRLRGADRYNAAIKLTGAEQTAGFDAAKQDFRQAAENSQKAVEFIQKEEVRTDPPGLAAQKMRKLSALSTRTESMRLFVTKVDTTQADAALVAYNEYIAAEPDAAKKQKAHRDAAQMLLDAGAADKALAEYQKILGENPDDPDANLGAGLALYASGDKAKYQEAANYLQHFVEKAPDGHKDKETIKAVLAELKSSENIVPEKTIPARRKRP